jgi:hypothetical protein
VPQIQEAHVSFGFFGDSLVPQRVTDLLGLSPTHAHARGDPHPIRSNPDLRWRSGAWMLDSQQSPDAPLDQHLRDLLDRLEPKAEAIRELVAEGLRASFSCGCFLEKENEGTTLPPQTLGRIAALGADLDLDIYYRGEAAPD